MAVMGSGRRQESSIFMGLPKLSIEDTTMGDMEILNWFDGTQAFEARNLKTQEDINKHNDIDAHSQDTGLSYSLFTNVKYDPSITEPVSNNNSDLMLLSRTRGSSKTNLSYERSESRYSMSGVYRSPNNTTSSTGETYASGDEKVSEFFSELNRDIGTTDDSKRKSVKLGRKFSTGSIKSNKSTKSRKGSDASLYKLKEKEFKKRGSTRTKDSARESRVNSNNPFYFDLKHGKTYGVTQKSSDNRCSKSQDSFTESQNTYSRARSSSVESAGTSQKRNSRRPPSIISISAVSMTSMDESTVEKEKELLQKSKEVQEVYSAYKAMSPRGGQGENVKHLEDRGKHIENSCVDYTSELTRTLPINDSQTDPRLNDITDPNLAGYQEEKEKDALVFEIEEGEIRKPNDDNQTKKDKKGEIVGYSRIGGSVMSIHRTLAEVKGSPKANKLKIGDIEEYNRLAKLQNKRGREGISIQLEFAKYLIKSAETLEEMDKQQNNVSKYAQYFLNKLPTAIFRADRGRVLELAKYWVDRLASDNVAEAIFIKADWYYNGKIYSKQKNVLKAIKYYAAAAKLGHASSAMTLAIHYENERNFKKAFQWYIFASHLNEPAAAYRLAIAYLCGELGLSVNLSYAHAYLRLSSRFASRDCPYGAYCLALMYLHEPPVHIDVSSEFPYNPELAHSSLFHAATLGYPPAHYLLGCLHETGDHEFLRSHRIAFASYHTAANLGHKEAQYSLCRMYLAKAKNELSESPNQLEFLSQAYRWCEKSAVQGYPTAEYKLAWFHDPETTIISSSMTKTLELPFSKDLSTAKAWYTKAANHNVADAIDWVVKHSY
ncbi:Protein SKT5 [Zancudomyces culisetae]|uniref:Protein SKT5 n=1 Tax=Zancudomyces culisetae TaxID=1213189 RepID=A0A1R1PRY0_ZANCU|nr:Protein SKT5 [Zancudomyces culisetae]|eukprot:OMH83740.1 Protein SKT5 [Zancudomyces culisetae]